MEEPVSTSPSSEPPKQPRTPRRRPRRTSVDRVFSVKKIHKKRPMTSITSVENFMGRLQTQMQGIHQKRCCLAQKIREFEELIEKALKKYNDLKNLEVNLGGVDDEEYRDFKWMAMEKLEEGIMTLQEKVAGSDGKLKRDRAELRRRHGTTQCCRYCAGRLPL